MTLVPRRFRLPGLVLAASFVVVGCSGGCSRSGETPDADEGAAGAPIDLLVRRPDAVLEQAGVLVPSPAGKPWGEYQGSGWVARLPEGATHVETNQPEAHLRLPATTDPAPEAITLTLWSEVAEGDEPASAVVKLNGALLETIESVPTSPEEVRIETPDEVLWRLGDNALVIASGDAESWTSLSVSRVDYGPERRVEYDADARACSLPAGTGLRYLLELRGQGELRVEAESAGAGELLVRTGATDPRTGEPDPEAERATTLRVDGARSLGVVIPDAGGRLASVQLVWTSAAGTPLDVKALEVVEEDPVERPPIVLVSIDTLAARHMSLHGYDRETTPNLDRLAAEAVVFERCIANASWTMPSYMSALTGLFARSHYVDELAYKPGLQLDSYDYWQVAESRWTLAEALRARGYRTAGAVDTAWLSPRFRFDQGFDLYDSSAAEIPFDEPTGGIAYLLDHFGPWLDARPGAADGSGAPFFAFIHALDAHGPYWPEAPFRDAFRGDLPEERRMAPAGSAHQTYRAIPTWMAHTHSFDRDAPIPEELSVEEVIARYDETILKVDAYLGRLFDMLKERGLYDGAVIVITGDHGESFDHQHFGHGGMWEDIVHVPLVIKLPGGELGGTRVARSVNLVDLYPTLCELAGIPEREHLHGRSLLALARGEETAPRVTFSEGGHIEQFMVEVDGWKLVELRPGARPMNDAPLLTYPELDEDWRRANLPDYDPNRLTDEAWKALREQADFRDKMRQLQSLLPDTYALYHLPSDPKEQHDVSAKHPEKVEHLRALLEEAKARTRRAQDDANPEIVPEPYSAAEIERLRQLGYL